MRHSVTVSVADLITAARNLRSEHGENREYDRALAELVADVVGMDRTTAWKQIGIKSHTDECIAANDRSASEVCICGRRNRR